MSWILNNCLLVTQKLEKDFFDGYCLCISIGGSDIVILNVH